MLLDPQLRLVLDVIPCEDAHAQERSLLDEVLPSFEAGDLAIADRNFCCTRFVFGLRDRHADFLIRQHASTLLGKRLLGKRKRIGRCESGMVYEQEMEIRNAEEADPQKQVMCLRRITIELDEPTRDGETVIHLVTNVPAEAADAIVLAELYLRRWDIESAFQEIEQALRSEVDTLCYPESGFVGVLHCFDNLQRAEHHQGRDGTAHRNPSLLFDLSGYYLAEEISATYWGMVIAIEPATLDAAVCRSHAGGNGRVLARVGSQRGPQPLQEASSRPEASAAGPHRRPS